MAKVDTETNQATLESLYNVQSKLFSIPKSERKAMGFKEKLKYSNDLHQISTAVLKLEAAELEGVNDAFKEKEQELKIAAANLEQNTAALDDSVEVIKVASEGLTLITNIIKLLS